MGQQSRDRFAAVVRDPQVRLDLACLLIAAEALPPDRAEPPALDRFLDAGLAELDRLATQVPREGRADSRLRAVLNRFRGDAEDYQRLESSLLPEVLRRGRGLPILLSTVWTEVARRADVPAYGVALPGHFVVGVGDPTTFRADALDGDRVLVDPFRGGVLLPYDGARDLVERAGQVFRRDHLAPADPLATVARMLANIRAWATPPLRASTRLWAIDLALLLPHRDVTLHRERALALLHLGRYGQAALGFEDYAERVAETAPLEAETATGFARRARAHLN
jgi:regulator of sirC expression with transglutaminase-like and TPR domain